MANRVRSARPRAVFCRVGWMKYYGLRAEEGGPEGGGAFNENDVGAEASNYRESAGRYNGFAQMPAPSGFNLPRVDPAVGRDVEKVEDVLIVMVAKNPIEGGQVVVGWHAAATCFADIYNERDGRPYIWVAAPEMSVLLPAAQRTIRVPKGKGAMGQANVSYTFSPDGEPAAGSWIDEVLEAIATYAGPDLIRGARYDTADECSGYVEQRRQWAVSNLFGSDAATASPTEPFDFDVRRNGREERVLLFIQEGPLGPIELDAQRLERVRGATTPITLYVISEVRTHVCNDELRFKGGKVHREENFCPGPNDVVPVVVRYDPSRARRET